MALAINMSPRWGSQTLYSKSETINQVSHHTNKNLIFNF
jgi:hypothetical protein